MAAECSRLDFCAMAISNLTKSVFAAAREEGFDHYAAAPVGSIAAAGFSSFLGAGASSSVASASGRYPNLLAEKGYMSQYGRVLKIFSTPSQPFSPGSIALAALPFALLGFFSSSVTSPSGM